MDQQSDYLNLHDKIAGIHPSGDLVKELAGLAEKPILQGDALELLLLAEQAMHAHQWQAAAQLFSLMMVRSFGQGYDEAYLVEHANRITLLTTEHETELQSATDLLLYGHRRLIASLRGDGMQQPYLGEWMVSAFSKLLQVPEARVAAMRAMAELHPGNNRITKRYQSEIGPARVLLACSLRLQGDAAANIWVSNKGRRRNFGLLLLAVVAIAVLAYGCRHWFPIPAGSLLDRYWLGYWLRAALIAWPLLLIATWFFAFFESTRTRAFHFISPSHLLTPGKIIAGEIVPFSRDWFFHIFQFVWIALLLIAWLLFNEWQELPGWLPSVWSSAAQNSLLTFIDSLKVSFLPHVPVWREFWSYIRALFGNDFVALVVAIAFCTYSIRRQRNIQKERTETNTDFYWWDRRINPTEWRIRLIMVGVDLFLVSFLLVKILMVLFVTYELVTTNALLVWYFAPDGVGGLKHLTDMQMHLSWIVFLFGMFVFASLYLHWNLREYRRNDLTLVVAYVLLMALTVAPIGILEFKLSHEKDVRLERLAKAGNKPEATLEDVGKYVRDVNSIHDWRVSAVDVGILGNSVLPLGFQFVVILLQFLGRAGKLPKLPIPGLNGESARKGAHDTH